MVGVLDFESSGLSLSPGRGHLMCCVLGQDKLSHGASQHPGTYIYLINQARGPYWENIGPRS